MQGINLRPGYGGPAVVTSTQAATANNMSPAVATYGPPGAAVVNAGPGIVNSSPASWAIYVGIAALVLLVMRRRRRVLSERAELQPEPIRPRPRPRPRSAS